MSFLNISLGDVGFCGGVSRADKMIQEIREKEEGDIFVFGNLIHNHAYEEWMKTERIFVLSSLKEAEGKIVIIRTHGISPEDEKQLKFLAKKVYDLTCPLVKMIHEKVERFAKEGYAIILTGKPNHAETIGIVGYTQGNIFLIKEEQDLLDLDFDKIRTEKVVLLSQSTFGQDNFLRLSSLLLEKIPHLLIENTICYAPTQRQEDIVSLTQNNDLVIVVGGRHSSNTLELFQKAKEISPHGKVHHIESSEEMDQIDFSGISRVGVASGTSTPDFLIKEVKDKIQKFFEK